MLELTKALFALFLPMSELILEILEFFREYQNVQKRFLSLDAHFLFLQKHEKRKACKKIEFLC